MVNLRKTNDVRPVVYLDETWVNQNHTRNYIWHNSEGKEGFKVPTGKGGRIIICHSGSSSFGFVNNSKLVFRCKSGPSEDYHSHMNYIIILKDWFIQMLNNLEEPSVIVMDNASYHSVLVDNFPKNYEKKSMYKNSYKKREFSFHPWKHYRFTRACKAINTSTKKISAG